MQRAGGFDESPNLSGEKDAEKADTGEAHPFPV